MKTFILIASLLFSTSTFAQFRLFTSTTNPEASWLMAEVEKLLPKKMKQDINAPVQIHFEALDNTSDWRSPCENNTEKQIYGRLRGQRLSLHSHFLQQIKTGGTFSCGHGNWRRQAVATLIHELVHLWEKTLPAPPSSSKHYTALAYGKWNLLRVNRIRNKRSERTPDAYELKNTQEHFAVNVEYLILDRSYGCRRPNLARYFSKLFQLELASCSPLRQLKVQEAKVVLDVELTTDKIKEVHYLLAGKGESAMSRFGHAMFRLVTDDPSQDLVIGFVAQINESTVNQLDGLTGKYPSRLSVTTMTKTIENYSKNELRELTSYPLKLSTQEREQFLDQVLNLYWEYAGKYYFISNNCADEALSLLKTVVVSPGFFSESVLTPSGVLRTLRKYDLVDENRKIHMPSHWKVLEQIFLKIAPELGETELDDWWKLSALERRNAFSELGSKVSLYAALSIESAAARAVGRKLEHALLGQLLTLEEGHELPQTAQRLHELQNNLLFGQRLKRGYGIPVTDDFSSDGFKPVDALQEMNQLLARMAAWGDSLHLEEKDELIQIGENQRVLRAMIRQL